MPGAVHIAQVVNIIRSDRADGLSLDDRAVLSGLLQKADSFVVGDSTGRRFTSEASPFGLAFDNWKVGGYFYSIYSQADLDGIKAKGFAVPFSQMFLGQGAVAAGTPIANLDKILQVGEATGNVVRADSLEALADKLGIPADAFLDEVSKYNSYADGSASDPFGKDKSLIKPISSTGPYVAILGAGYYYGTCGGLNIDVDMQVLDVNGSVIPGLYATGQESSGVLFSPEQAYVTYGGAAQGWAITSGRLAGEHAAAAFK
jgi:hypothetical protein